MKIHLTFASIRRLVGRWSLFLLFLPATAAWGAGAQAPVTLVVDPTAAPRPALRYTLVHEAIDQLPGNAAIAYDRAMATIAQYSTWNEDRGKCSEWLRIPLEDFPADEVSNLLQRYRSSLEQLAQASRYEQCDWQIPIREMGLGANLPHLSALRDAARLLALDARLQIKQQRFGLAIEQLRTGMTLAHHAAHGPTLIEGLVGLAIDGMMLDQVQDFIQAPGAPSLYWALTELLPNRPNAWQSTRWERCFLYVHLPILWDMRTRPVTAADLRQSIISFQEMSGGGLKGGVLTEGEKAEVLAAAVGVALYPRARQALIDQGRAPALVDALPVAQVIADYIGGAYAAQRDDLFKWFALPYHQARAGLAQADKDMQAGIAEDPMAHFITRMFLPALGRVAEKYSLLDRRLAALRCVEAIRLYAASDEGKLPAALNEIKAVPVPVDPMTNESFGYQQQGNKATIEAPLDLHQPAGLSVLYEITLRP